MKCQKCNSSRVATINSKCSDCFNATLQTCEYDGYVPDDMGIGGGDYVGFNYCLDCGQIQGKFPLQKTDLENSSPKKGDLCPNCEEANLNFVSPDVPWTSGHLQCPECDSTYFIDDEKIREYMNE